MEPDKVTSADQNRAALPSRRPEIDVPTSWSQRFELASGWVDLPSQIRAGSAGVSATTCHRLDRAVAKRLAGVARDLSLSPFAAAFAACQVLLSRYTGENSFLLGTTLAADRTDVLICADVAAERTFADVAAQVAADLAVARHHPQLVAEVGERWRAATDGARATPSGVTFSEVWPGSDLARSRSVDLVLWQQSEIRCRYATGRHTIVEIDQFLEHYALLLGRLLHDPWERTSSHPILGEQQHRTVVELWNGTVSDYPADRTIQELFEGQVAAAPDADALFFAGQAMSYATLNRKANRLAACLRRQGVAPGAVVALCIPRSFELVVALLAILKAGASYLPFDDALPEERLVSMLDDAQAMAVLITSEVQAIHPGIGARAIVLDQLASAVEQESDGDLPVSTSAGDIAYINYTSGSTGRPKGVAIRHRSVARLIFGCRYARLGRTCRVLQLAAPSFDALTFELWAPLLTGGCCVLYDGKFPTLPRLRETIRKGRVNTVFLTTALFNTIVDEMPDLLAPVEQLLTGGEAHSVAHMRRALARLPATCISNVYGPTENTTFTTFHPVETVPEDARSIAIGKPIGNTKAFVLDQHHHLAAVGVVGELYVGGPGLAAGYIGRPDLTAERFVRGFPFLPPDEILYRTGDLARWLPDGSIDFVGRSDSQVKLNGYRIELGEIEAKLVEHPAVSQSAVTVRETAAGARRLIAFLVGRGHASTVADLRRHLAVSLPNYMIPAEFHWLEALPLTPHGKLDRNRLAALPAGKPVLE